MREVYKKFFLMLGFTVLLCLSASIVWGETLDDLIKRDGIYYKKFKDVPYTGKIKGKGLIGVYQGSFKGGKMDGEWLYYRDDGNLWRKEFYAIGTKTEYWKEFSPNGNLRNHGHYKNDKRDGLWEQYFYNSTKLNFKGSFKDGKKEGKWIIFDEAGKVRKEYTGIFKNGEKVSD